MEEEIFWAKVCKKNLYKYAGGDLYHIWIGYHREQLYKEIQQAKKLLAECEQEMSKFETAIAERDAKIHHYSERLKTAIPKTLRWEICQFELKMLHGLPSQFNTLKEQRQHLIKQLEMTEERVNSKLASLTPEVAESYFNKLFKHGFNKCIWSGMEFLVTP